MYVCVRARAGGLKHAQECGLIINYYKSFVSE